MDHYDTSGNGEATRNGAEMERKIVHSERSKQGESHKRTRVL